MRGHLEVLEEFRLFLSHVIVRLQCAVDDILSLNKLPFERLDSASPSLVSPNSHAAAAAALHAAAGVL